MNTLFLKLGGAKIEIICNESNNVMEKDLQDQGRKSEDREKSRREKFPVAVER